MCSVKIELGENWKDHYDVEKRPAWKSNDFKTLKIYRSVSVNDLAKSLKVAKKQLIEWNTDMTSSVTTASLNQPFTLYVHKSVDLKGVGVKISALKRVTNNRKQRRLISSVGKRNSIHKVRKGENLTLIAKKYRTKISTLRKLNRLNRKGRIRTGQSLKLPNRQSISSKIYRVRAGDNLIKISRKFKIPVKRLKLFNGLTHSKIYPKQRLRIPSNG